MTPIPAEEAEGEFGGDVCERVTHAEGFLPGL